MKSSSGTPLQHAGHAAATDLNVTAVGGGEDGDTAIARAQHVAEAAEKLLFTYGFNRLCLLTLEFHGACAESPNYN
ncbi:MAG: hypothetical protein QOD99_2903 [Chthoniobacter sp.]|nr:hypothetical protein [Chthoniobacter sp.]